MTSVSTLGSSQISAQIATVQARMQAPITSLKSQIGTEQANISAWGAISGAVSSLSQALSNIKDVASINSRSVSTSDNTKITATASNSAAAGTYNFTNIALAKSQEIYSSLLGSGGTTLSGGAGAMVFSLSNGKSETVSIGSGSLTLNGVAAAINKQGGPVQASVVGTKAGARLVLKGSATGSSAAFNVSGTGALAQFNYNPSSAHTGETLAQAATDASLTLNGIPITSTTNTLGSAVAGVTISLAGSGNASVSVSSSPTNLSSSVQAVATGLNAAIATIAKETKYVPASSGASSSSAKSGPLLGNYSATSLKNDLVSAVSGLMASGVSAGAAGLSVSGSGTISFNATSFASEYAQNPNAVQKLVSDLYTKLNGITTGAIGAASGSSNGVHTAATTGFISAATASLNASVSSIDSQITQMQKQDAAQLKILAQQYTAAESTAYKASISQSYLSIFLGGSSNSSG